MRKRRTPEIIAGRVAADGSILSGDGFTVSKTGTGVFQLNFPSTFRIISVIPSAYGGSFASEAGSPTSGAVTITLRSSTTAAVTDGPFNFAAYGIQV